MPVSHPLFTILISYSFHVFLSFFFFILLSYNTFQMQPPLLPLLPGLLPPALFPTSTSSPFSFRKEQTSQWYQPNSSKEHTIRLGTSLHAMAEWGYPGGVKGPKNKYKSQQHSQLLLLGFPQQPQTKQTQHVCWGSSIDPWGSMITVSLYETCLIDYLGLVLESLVLCFLKAQLWQGFLNSA